MVESLRGARVLAGTRGRQPLDVEALVQAVVRMSELSAGLPANVATVEINPLLVLPRGEGVLMLDAAMELEDVADDAD